MTSKAKRGPAGEIIGHVEVIEDDLERTIDRLWTRTIAKQDAARKEREEWHGMLWNMSYGAGIHR